MHPETFRKTWNGRQKELRSLLTADGRTKEAVALFLIQHAGLHAAEIAQPEVWSYADEILDGLTEEQYRRIPQKAEHSIIWNIWHLARIEDVTMNMLVAGSPQLAHTERWFERMQVPFRHTGNAMSQEDINHLSAVMDIKEMLSYRLAVGRRTREIVQQIPSGAFNQKAQSARLQQVLGEDAVLPEAHGIVDYWSKRTITGLLLMPPTRHGLAHLNECLRLKNKRT